MAENVTFGAVFALFSVQYLICSSHVNGHMVALKTEILSTNSVPLL